MEQSHFFQRSSLCAQCWGESFKAYNKSIFQKIIQKMHYNTFIGSLFQLSTMPTLSTTFLPTLTFLYPTQSVSSVIDFHYNCNPHFRDIPVYFHSHSLPQQQTAPESPEPPTEPKIKMKKPRNRNEKKEIESAKKNSESNLVNQLYSYFSHYEKSQKIVEKVIKSLKFQSSQIQKIKSIFYNTVRLINFKRGRKYVNKDNILAYYKPQNCILNLAEIAHQLQNLKLITVKDFCYIFRVCTYHFIKEISITAILTSKRITSIARNQHLKRRRRVFNSLNQHDSH